MARLRTGFPTEYEDYLFPDVSRPKVSNSRAECGSPFKFVAAFRLSFPFAKRVPEHSLLQCVIYRLCQLLDCIPSVTEVGTSLEHGGLVGPKAKMGVLDNKKPDNPAKT
jgi:hypothetical protein